MSDPAAIARQSKPHEINLVGIGLGHSLTPLLHNFLAKSIDVPWRVKATECPIIEDVVRLFRSPRQAGGVVTMPWKGAIIKHLDHIDDVAKMLGAVNVVSFDAAGRLCGGNTDWAGIEGALRTNAKEECESWRGSAALLVGAGGAARAAVYALTFRFGVKSIYVLNRDDDEVTQMVNDCAQMGCSLVHVKSLEQAQSLALPSLAIGTVPDFEAKTVEEKAVKAILDYFLTAVETGVMLDMCYHPTPQTRNLKLAEAHGWQTVQGSQVIGHQVEALWRFWISEGCLKGWDKEGMWRLLDEAIGLDSSGRQALNRSVVESHFGPA